MLNIIQVRYIGWDLFWVLFFFLAVAVVVMQQEEDGMTNVEKPLVLTIFSRIKMTTLPYFLCNQTGF
jgi:hypothetical protein